MFQHKTCLKTEVRVRGCTEYSLIFCALKKLFSYFIYISISVQFTVIIHRIAKTRGNYYDLFLERILGNSNENKMCIIYAQQFCLFYEKNILPISMHILRFNEQRFGYVFGSFAYTVYNGSETYVSC